MGEVGMPRFVERDASTDVSMLTGAEANVPCSPRAMNLYQIESQPADATQTMPQWEQAQGVVSHHW